MVTIILLPGMDGTGNMFEELTAFLEKQFRLIIVSYPAEQAIGYQELESYVRSCLPVDGLFILLAESFSGPIAISLAASKPSGLIGLILCCTFARNPVPWLAPCKGLITRLPMSSRFAGLLSPWLLGRFSTPKLRMALRQVLTIVPGRTLQMRLFSVLDVDYSSRVPDIEVPILYLQAANDCIVPSSASQHIQSLAHRMTIIRLAGPHLLLQALPRETAGLIRIFANTIIASANNNPLP